MASLSSTGARKSPTMIDLEEQISRVKEQINKFSKYIQQLDIEYNRVQKNKKVPDKIAKNYGSTKKKDVLEKINNRSIDYEGKKQALIEQLNKLKRQRADNNYSTRQQISGDFDKKVFNVFETNDPMEIQTFISNKEDNAMMEPIDPLIFESIKLGTYNYNEKKPRSCFINLKKTHSIPQDTTIKEIVTILIYKCIAFVIPFINDCIASTVKIQELTKTNYLHQMPIGIIEENIRTLRREMQKINFYKLSKVAQDPNINCIKFIECILNNNTNNIIEPLDPLYILALEIISKYSRYNNLKIKELLKKYEEYLPVATVSDAEVAAATAAAATASYADPQRRPRNTRTILGLFNSFRKGGTRKKRKRKKTRRKHKKKTIRKKRRKKRQKTRRK